MPRPVNFASFERRSGNSTDPFRTPSFIDSESKPNERDTRRNWLKKAMARRSVRFIKAATRFQDLLGVHQDRRVGRTVCRGFLKYQGRRQAAFTAGLLAARANQRREEVREEFWSEWKRLNKRGKRAWN
jgi:hypothetical protein